MSYSIVGSDGRTRDISALINAYRQGRMGGEDFVGALGIQLSPEVMATLNRGSQGRSQFLQGLDGFGQAMARGQIAAPVAQLDAAGRVNFSGLNQPSIAQVTPGPIREVVQGLYDANPIAAGATRSISFNASMIFKPTRLMLGPTMAPVFAIEDLRVSSDSLFLSPGRVPGETFLPGSVGASALKRRSAQPGTPVSILVTNIDGAAHVFNAALFGESADFDGCGPG